jgi:hypothetical protein
LRLQALCDGILDASILTVYEGRWRAAEKREPKWLDHQAGKVMRAFAVLEAAPPALGAAIPDVGQIALACALGYRDLRLAEMSAANARVLSPGLRSSPRACQRTPPRRRPCDRKRKKPRGFSPGAFAFDRLRRIAAAIRTDS